MELTQDNGKKLSVTISEEELNWYVKYFFNWRTPTKNYKSFVDRFKHLGSYDYDRLIAYLYKLGF